MANFLSQKVVANFTLTHFFRSSSDQDSTKASSLLSSVLAQLIRHYTLRSTPRFFATLKAVLPLFDHFASGIDCPFHTLRPLMDDLFGILDDFVLVVDALDECSEINQSTTVTEWLNKVSRRPNARVIILSRYHDSFEDSLCDSFHLRMDSDLVSPDISLFVAAELQRTPKFRGMEKQIMMKIEEARGMFLWAKMMMEYLTKAATSNMVLRRLARFPAGLTAVYEKFLVETAASLEEEDIIRRKEIFMLLAAGVRPLSVEEISVALALKTTGRLHEDGDLLLDPKGEVLRLCWPLAMVVHGEAHLFHMSVKEFLLRSAEPLTKGSVQFSVQQCHTYMARRCLNRLDHTKYAATNRMESLLRHSVSTKKLSRGEISHLPLTLTFYEYACKNWQRHIAAASPSEDLLHQTNQFLHSHAFISWAESLHSISRDDMGPIIEVRAVLRSWQMTIPHVRQSLVNLLDFFTGPYNSAYLSFRDQGDNLLSSVVLERLGIFLNITAEHVPENLFTLYEILKLASEGYERVLGKRHPRTLNATALFCVERLVNKEHSAAETVSAGIASIQREVLGEESPDYFRTRQYQAVALFWQGKHIEAKVCAEESYIGLQRTLGGHQKDTLKSQMYVGWCLEVENELEAAARIYEEVYNAWIPIHGPDNPLSLYSQSCLAISLRKLGDFAAAERHMTQSLAARQRLFGADNLMTIDSAINLAVLYRDMDRPQEALALLEVAVTKGVKTPPIQGFERLCQTEHLRAQIEILAGELDNARRRLEMILLNATAEKLPNNRELFWIRLRLADMLRSEGLDEIAAALFSGIVKQTLDDYSAEIWKDTDPKYQLRIAEVALEFVQKHDTYGAEELLVAHGLNWGHPEDLWVLEGGPGAEI
jgi:tetratricopeptide (TPR) repeat protein